MGTRMYEINKETSLKTLKKKWTKVYEIYNVLTKDILLDLEKLGNDHLKYVQWENDNAKLDAIGTRMYEMKKEYVVEILEKN
jgi:hypothetical protein